MDDCSDWIIIRNAKENNLKSISLKIPKYKWIVFTGVSGSGKTSLAIDTIHREGQRRYFEVFAGQTNNFWGILQKPSVDEIEGLPPTVAFKYSYTRPHHLSTVGTFSEITDLLRLLYSTSSIITCTKCNKTITPKSAHEVVKDVSSKDIGSKLYIIAPYIRNEKSLYESIDWIRKQGFSRIRIDSKEIYELDSMPLLNANKSYSIDIVVDRIILKNEISDRLTESIELAFKVGNNRCAVISNDQETWYGSNCECHWCLEKFPVRSPNLFNFYHLDGMCVSCMGLGYVKNLPDNYIDVNEATHSINFNSNKTICATCNGLSIKNESKCYSIDGSTFQDLHSISIEDLIKKVSLISKNANIAVNTASSILQKISQILKTLDALNLSYLKLSDRLSTLSSGELQKIRLSTCLSNKLSGVLYIFDEPFNVLNKLEHQNIVTILKEIQNNGNTIIIVDHLKTALKYSDYIVEFGPNAGDNGGDIVFSGTINKLILSDTITRNYLLKEYLYPSCISRVQEDKKDNTLSIKNINHCFFSFDNISFPKKSIVSIVGLTGAGKSVFLYDVIYQTIKHCLDQKKSKGSDNRIQYQIDGLFNIDKIQLITPTFSNSNSKSIVGTYLNIWDYIRDIYSQTIESKLRGYTSQRFSFNKSDGQCKACFGEGIQTISFPMMESVERVCDQCDGRRFNPSTREILFKHKTISDLLSMSIEELYIFFRNHEKLSNALFLLIDVGMGYIRLGQTLSTLSGGERQRLKLCKELSSSTRIKKSTLYLFDTPSVGLHYDDITKLMALFRHLTERGDTIISVENNVDAILLSDYIIELSRTKVNTYNYKSELLASSYLNDYIISCNTPISNSIKELFTNIKK